MKGCMVYSCGMGDSVDVGVFLDTEKAKLYIDNMNKPYKEEMKLYDECIKCIEDGDNADEKVFKFQDTCERCKIGNDRYGKYCENEISDYYQLQKDSYYGREVDILE